MTVSLPTLERQPSPLRDAAGRPALRTRLGRRLVPYGYLSPTLVLLIILMMAPVVMVITYSVMDAVITSNESRFIGFDNYAEVLADPVFFTAARNTFYFCLVSVVGHFVIGLAFALLLNSKLIGARTKAVFRVIYIVPWVFTVAIIAVLWRMLLNPNGVVNYLLTSAGLTESAVEWLGNPDIALHAVTFINLWAGYPFFMVSLLAGLQGIPNDLYEAARVDGARWTQQFWHVTLPQLTPIIISMALLDFIWTSQQFALIWLTTGGGPVVSTELLSTFTYKLAFSRYEFSVASASAVLILLVSIVLAIFYVRYQKARD